MREIVCIAHNVRSTHNVGSLLRTCEGLGILKVFLTGYTPYPQAPGDTRLPHEVQRINKQISKTALGAENTLPWQHAETIEPVLQELQASGHHIAAVEQAPTSVKLPDFAPPEKLALIIGREVEGIEPEVLALCETILEIPMFGQKESFNVVQAAAMTLYRCRFA